MPEGDTIYRTADLLRTWLVGRSVTAARSRVAGLATDRLVGATVTAVESQGKHLLMRFSNGDTLHTHMRMTGSWHVYPAGGRWQRSGQQARVVIEAGDRVAVCFNAPVVELLASRAEAVHPALAGLGQDLLGTRPLDLEAARTRARRLTAEPDGTGGGRVIGEVLLDQRVVAGIGNIYRCETLFLCGVDPWTPVDGPVRRPARPPAVHRRPAAARRRRRGPAGPAGPAGPGGAGCGAGRRPTGSTAGPGDPAGGAARRSATPGWASRPGPSTGAPAASPVGRRRRRRESGSRRPQAGVLEGLCRRNGERIGCVGANPFPVAGPPGGRRPSRRPEPPGATVGCQRPAPCRSGVRIGRVGANPSPQSG